MSRSLPLNSAVTIVSDIKSGKRSCEEVVQSLLDAIERNDVGAFISLDKSRLLALARARELDARRVAGEPLGRLHGVPIVVKDNIHVKGLPNTAGTLALIDFTPFESAPVVARLEAEGAVVLGKTNMHELAMGVTSIHPEGSPFPSVRNACSPQHISGGSSGGTGAALGAGQAVVGLGTDTAGSIRIPAAMNGVFGLRPTTAWASAGDSAQEPRPRYPQEGITPCSATRDTAGPMGICVEDLALLDSIITGEPLAEPCELKGLRLGRPRFFWTELEADVSDRAEEALLSLSRAGVEVVPVDLDVKELCGKVGFAVIFFEMKRALTEYLEKYCPSVSVEDLIGQCKEPAVQRLFSPAAAGFFKPEEYTEALEKHRPALQKMYAETFERHSIQGLVFPTVKEPACKHSEVAGRPMLFADISRNTDPGTNAGLPGITLPIGKTSSGLPVGLAIDGPVDTDRNLLSIALAAQVLL
eukprot:gene10658-12605_t